MGTEVLCFIACFSGNCEVKMMSGSHLDYSMQNCFVSLNFFFQRTNFCWNTHIYSSSFHYFQYEHYFNLIATCTTYNAILFKRLHPKKGGHMFPVGRAQAKQNEDGRETHKLQNNKEFFFIVMKYKQGQRTLLCFVKKIIDLEHFVLHRVSNNLEESHCQRHAESNSLQLWQTFLARKVTCTTIFM